MCCAILVENFKVFQHIPYLRGVCFGVFDNEQAVRFSRPLFRFTASVELDTGRFDVGLYTCSVLLPADKYLDRSIGSYVTFKCELTEDIF